MHPARPSRRTRAGILVAVAAGLSLVATSAYAAVTPGDDSAALAAAMSAAPVTGSSLATDYPCGTECPTGVGTTPLAGFPTNGSTYTILTTGDAALADQPNDSTGSGKNWGVVSTAIGPTVHDSQVLRVDLGPATGSCLAFDFRFLSEEYPEYVTSGFNDAFVAQLNVWGVTADPNAQTVNAPGDFAAGAGDAISVDASGPSAMTEAQAAGTTYDGATLPLVARKPVTPGSTNTLYLTIFDQGDGILDTAVLVDNLRYENVAAAQCKSLAVEPFEGTTGVSLAPGTAPAFAPGFTSMGLPLVCNLPQGPLSCSVSATSAFTPTPLARSTRLAAKATTALGSGSVTIAGGGSGTLTLTSSPAGVAALKAAAAQPSALAASAKKLAKQAKKLKKKAKAASGKKAKKLSKKAKKLAKRATATKKQAAALAKTPLGSVAVTITNPANGKTEVLTVQVPR